MTVNKSFSNKKFSLSVVSLYLCVSLLSPFAQAKESNPDTNQTLAALKAGNQRFITGKVRSDGQSQADIAKLASGQSPKAIVLSCSDSRVPPELVFDQKLGEMFTVRTAGEALSPQAIASIEFGIEKLGTTLVVVLGHSNCGAVKATLDTPQGKSAGSKNLDQLIADIRPRLKKDQPRSQDLKSESWQNARGVAHDLVSRSRVIATALAAHKITIQVGLYDLATGAVAFE